MIFEKKTVKINWLEILKHVVKKILSKKKLMHVFKICLEEVFERSFNRNLLNDRIFRIF